MEIENANLRNGSITGALTTGIIGTALGVLNGGAGLLNLNGNVNKDYVTKDELALNQQLASKDSTIALLQANSESEKKMIDVYERVMSKVNANHEAQATINQTQAVFNAQIGSQVAINTNNINQLMGMTKLYIPAANVTPEPMPLLNKWEAPSE